jgi:hypothetical protein
MRRVVLALERRPSGGVERPVEIRLGGKLLRALGEGNIARPICPGRGGYNRRSLAAACTQRGGAGQKTERKNRF